MNHTLIETAARHLYAARIARRPTNRIPETCRPGNVDEGWAILKRVAALLEQPIGGWKCSMPNTERTINAAPIFAPTIHRASPCPILPIAGMARIEPEIAFVIGRDLPPRATRYGDDEVRAAIREIRMVLELIGPRYADPAVITFPELLADNVANQGLYVGPVIAPTVDAALANDLSAFPIAVHQATPGADDVLLTREGKHPDGSPLLPLIALANFLAHGGYGGSEWLRVGQVVTTGSYCGVIDVPLETALSVRFGDLGALPVRLTAMN